MIKDLFDGTLACEDEHIQAHSDSFRLTPDVFLLRRSSTPSSES